MYTKDDIIILFSGGRDSTLTTVYSAEQFHHLSLVTIKSVNLTELENVYKRLKELQPLIHDKSSWELYKKIETIPLKRLKKITCLPCQAYYVALAMCLCKDRNIPILGVGYVGYQKCWEEQSDYAKESLRNYLRKKNIELYLPVENINSKEEAKRRLASFGLSEESKEQKCLKAKFNQTLQDTEKREQIDEWIPAIETIYNLLQDKYFTTRIDIIEDL